MALQSWLLFALASYLLLAVGQAVVWGPRQAPSRGQDQIEPTVVEIPESSAQTLLEVAEKAIDPTKKYRSRRQSNTEDDSIGHTTPLIGDHHTFALVHWTGYPSEHLFILTRQRTRQSGYTYSDQSWLWRSKDYGHTFVNDTIQWANDTIIEWYYISPFSEYLIFADRTNNRLYITSDEGDTYRRSDISFRPDRLTFQSRSANHSTESPYNRYVLGYDSAARSLWVSVDLGITWRKLSDNVVENRYYWRRMDSDPLGAVYFEKNITVNESQLYVVWNVSDQSSQPVLFDRDLDRFMVNTFVMELEYMFVQKNDTGVGEPRYSSPLWVSHNRQSFRQARFPLQTEEKHYSVVDASEGQVFIAVYHDINNTNLYLSEEEGLNYSLSLQYIISPPESDWLDGYPRFDVHVVEGIVGTYMANQKVPGSRYGASVISYDKGGEWVWLVPPAVDSTNRPTLCAPPECSLHLHMESDRNNGYQSILSQDSAVGLLMALGNLGSSLSGSRNNVHLYFSRDGGFTWFEVGTGFWEFQFAALGSVVVTVKKRIPTSTIQWSCDEGHTWTTTNFAETTGFGMTVIGMLTEREEKALHVTIFGYNFGQREWLIVDLNFTSVVPNQCVEEDYFPWLPSDERPGSRCLLGEVITYERRNATDCCYIDPLYERPVNRTPCVCTIEDFECDFGFERLSLNSPCTPLPWIQWPPPPPDYCSEGLNYTITSGYRRIAGDKCIRGTESYFFELVRDCPALPPQGLFLRVQGQPTFHPGRTIPFQLAQFAGWKRTSWYQWDFNDTSPLVNVTGFDSASIQSHTFTRPGRYKVKVRAGNNAGSSATVLEVTIYDIIQSVSIQPPIQASGNGSVPTGISLVFRANKITQYNTDIVESVTYRWSFGDGSQTEETNETIISHVFYTPGNYVITLSVTAASTQITITVYESAKHVQIETLGGRGGIYVEVNVKTSFRVTAVSDEAIPTETSYRWHIVSTDNPIEFENNSPLLSYTFPSYGRYDLSVIGNHSAGSFSAQIAIEAENYLHSITVAYIPTVRAGGQPAVAWVSARLNSSLPYEGPFTYHLTGEGGKDFTGVIMTVIDGSLNVSFMPSVELAYSKDVPVTFNVSNHISTSATIKYVGVVVPGDYGSISLKFPVSDLPTNYNSSQWMSSLKDAIMAALTYKFPKVHKSQIEIESTQIKSEDEPVTSVTPSPSQQSPRHNLLRRSDGTNLKLFVNVNILPLSASAENISSSKALSRQLVNGSLVVRVGNDDFTAEIELRLIDGIIVDPGESIVVTNWKLYSGIGGGLGAVLVVGVATAVVLGIVIYYYRRRYNRLQVRYSRLSQAPVRFTFTQSGEMMEEDDPDINAEDTTCAETDNDEQPLKKLTRKSPL